MEFRLEEYLQFVNEIFDALKKCGHENLLLIFFEKQVLENSLSAYFYEATDILQR